MSIHFLFLLSICFSHCLKLFMYSNVLIYWEEWYLDVLCGMCFCRKYLMLAFYVILGRLLQSKIVFRRVEVLSCSFLFSIFQVPTLSAHFPSSQKYVKLLESPQALIGSCLRPYMLQTPFKSFNSTDFGKFSLTFCAKLFSLVKQKCVGLIYNYGFILYGGSMTDWFSL